MAGLKPQSVPPAGLSSFQWEPLRSAWLMLRPRNMSTHMSSRTTAAADMFLRLNEISNRDLQEPVCMGLGWRQAMGPQQVPCQRAGVGTLQNLYTHTGAAQSFRHIARTHQALMDPALVIHPEPLPDGPTLKPTPCTASTVATCVPPVAHSQKTHTAPCSGFQNRLRH